jgi:hypothetical protein
MHKRVADVEKLAANCDTAIRELTARFDRQPPRGDPGLTGPKGDSGRDAVCCCKNGADSTIPGPRGERGLTGSSGRNGTDGKDSPSATEYSNLLLEVQKLNKETRGLITAQNENISLLYEVIVGTNQKTSDYLAFLEARAQARRKAHTS